MGSKILLNEESLEVSGDEDANRFGGLNALKSRVLSPICSRRQFAAAYYIILVLQFVAHNLSVTNFIFCFPIHIHFIRKLLIKRI